MRRSTRLFAVVALSVGGLSLPAYLVAEDRAGGSAGQTGGDRSTVRSDGRDRSAEGANTGTSSSARTAGDREQAGDRAKEVRGIQELFARAIDSAVSPAGLRSLHELFAEGGERHQGEGAAGTERHSDRGTSGAADSSRTSARVSGATGTGGTAGDNSQSGRDREARAGHEGASEATVGGNEDTRQLDQIVQQIRQEWQQKYKQEFRITDASQVFNDITAADIGGHAQAAAGEIRGSRRGSSDATSSGSSSDSNSRSTDTGSRSGVGDTAHTGGTGTGTSGSSARSNDAGSARSSRSGEQTRLGAAESAGERQSHEAMTINVPAVRGAASVEVRVVRESGDQFRFAPAHRDRHMLAQNLQTHLQEVQQHQQDWPADVNEGYRIVAQHVLMAISETQGRTSDQGEPASGRIRGNGGGNSSDNGTSSDRDHSAKSGAEGSQSQTR
jgi:hypothetical protein